MKADFSHDEFLQMSLALNNLLDRHLAVENAMFNCGLRPFDFPEAAQQIREVRGALDEACAIFSAAHGHTAESQESIGAGRKYANSFCQSVKQLELICSKLASKARGNSYGFFEYRRDMKDYKALEATRVSHGNELNRGMSRSW